MQQHFILCSSPFCMAETRRYQEQKKGMVLISGLLGTSTCSQHRTEHPYSFLSYLLRADFKPLSSRMGLASAVLVQASSWLLSCDKFCLSVPYHARVIYCTSLTHCLRKCTVLPMMSNTVHFLFVRYYPEIQETSRFGKDSNLIQLLPKKNFIRYPSSFTFSSLKMLSDHNSQRILL